MSALLSERGVLRTLAYGSLILQDQQDSEELREDLELLNPGAAEHGLDDIGMMAGLFTEEDGLGGDLWGLGDTCWLI